MHVVSAHLSQHACLQVILNDRIDKVGGPDGVTYTTQKGRTVKADVVFWCTGTQRNTAFMTEALGDALDQFWAIKVRHSTINLHGLYEACGEGGAYSLYMVLVGKLSYVCSNLPYLMPDAAGHATLLW